MGVYDLPYAHDKDGKGTGDVAEILEAKYHPMELYWESHENEIVGHITEAMAGVLESVFMGAPPPEDLTQAVQSGCSQIDAGFKMFLSSREFEYQARLAGNILDVPTKAALAGVNHRKKLKKGARRPSLIDTGLYESSFVSWVERD